MTDELRALADRLRDLGESAKYVLSPYERETLGKAAAALDRLQAAERDAYERAAKVCEGIASDCVQSDDMTMNGFRAGTGMLCAKAIRALIDAAQGAQDTSGDA
jgi:hypothetical protein